VKIKAAIIGCGLISYQHARAWRFFGNDGGLIACADIKRDALDKFGDECKINARYLDYNEMMEKEKPDVVHVCVFETIHKKVVLDLIKYRPKAIICEKPISLTLKDADEMINVCRENGILLLVSHQRRGQLTAVTVKKLLAENKIGALTGIFAGMHGRSSLFVDGTHLFNLISYFMDDKKPEYVFGQFEAFSGKVTWGHTNEDASMISYVIDNVQISCSLGGVSRISDGELSVKPLVPSVNPSNLYYTAKLVGEEGIIEIKGDVRPHETNLYSNDFPVVKMYNKEGEHIVLTFGDFMENQDRYGFAPVIRSLIQSLKTGEESIFAAEYARAAIEMVAATVKSAVNRSFVKLPVESTDFDPTKILTADAHNRLL